MLSVMSASLVVYELLERYDRQEISYDRFKFLAAMAIAKLIYSTNELVSEKTG